MLMNRRDFVCFSTGFVACRILLFCLDPTPISFFHHIYISTLSIDIDIYNDIFIPRAVHNSVETMSDC